MEAGSAVKTLLHGNHSAPSGEVPEENGVSRRLFKGYWRSRHIHSLLGAEASALLLFSILSPKRQATDTLPGYAHGSFWHPRVCWCRDSCPPVSAARRAAAASGGMAAQTNLTISRAVSFLLFRFFVVLLAAVGGPMAAAEVKPEELLAAKVREIAGSASLPREEREKSVADAVRVAVTAALEGITDDEKALAIALTFARSAATAAPEFALVIGNVVSGLAPIAKIGGAAGKIEAVVRAAAKAARSGNEEFGGEHSDVVVSPSR